ncbi:hypothetical protein FB451DRAFT_1192911 [Mycena latifolia]|nr:hypothetical protein FB451DRAFT_1194727 [Mycena latifolia]KAJ7438074.1 hypothetical protein FB451DRAFT_1192911 [Mycena latifolia]
MSFLFLMSAAADIGWCQNENRFTMRTSVYCSSLTSGAAFKAPVECLRLGGQIPPDTRGGWLRPIFHSMVDTDMEEKYYTEAVSHRSFVEKFGDPLLKVDFTVKKFNLFLREILGGPRRRVGPSCLPSSPFGRQPRRSHQEKPPWVTSSNSI